MHFSIHCILPKRFPLQFGGEWREITTIYVEIISLAFYISPIIFALLSAVHGHFCELLAFR